MRIIGLTGNIGCGKTTVARMLGELGAQVVDADRVAHTVMTPDTPVWQQIVATFGREIVRPDGQIDRQRLGETVFSDPDKLAALERIVHPAVVERVDEIVRESRAPVVVVEAIKLIEAGMHRRSDSLWVVTCTPEQQLARILARGLSEDQARARIGAQSPQAEKAALADVVIDNSGTLESTRSQVERAYRRLVGKPGHADNRGDATSRS